NVVQMVAMLEKGTIGQVTMVCSHYFSKTSAPLYDFALAEFSKRPDRMTSLSLRTHAKILLLALADGRKVTCEASANLRSSRNLEQATMFGNQGLYNFHAQWINDLVAASKGK